MSKNNKAVKDFLDAIPDEKLKNFVTSEKTMVKDRKHGFRLDHQGVNNDGTSRLYIQRIPGGKSQASMGSTKNVIAQIHVMDPADPNEIRQALFDSYKTRAKLIKLT
ncbi:hypothetical protein P7C71_g239, partial [Lecanoromycetidae sp. Uapishka_2]